VGPDPAGRDYNSARLALARAHFTSRQHKDIWRVLRPSAKHDAFAHEHRAWFQLLIGNADAATRDLQPLLDRQEHREGRNLANFLYGVCLMMAGRQEQARAVFELLPACRFPRTWTLGSYFATGRLACDDAAGRAAALLPWERRHLYAHRALLARAQGDRAESERCWSQSVAPLTGP